MKTPPEMSKYRQTLYLQAEKWDTMAEEAAKGHLLSTSAAETFCRGEAEKCRQALKRVRGRTKQQLRAGW